MSSGTAIKVMDLRMRYGDRDVLDGVNFSVEAGEVVTLLGPNGAGKTTTIEILEGFRVRSAGTVNVLGVDPLEGDEDWRADIGVVLQSWRDHPRWTPVALLDFLGRYYRPYSTDQRARPIEADELISMVGLQEHRDQKIRTLSGGQRRRLDVAIGLVGRPSLLFLDEPTAGFDPEAKRDFHDLIDALSDLEETTILLTTHDLAEAEKLADRILILAGGRIVADGSAEALAKSIGGESRVRWRRGTERFETTTPAAARFVQKLFADHGDEIEDLEVHRASLEDTYLALLHQYESGIEPKSDAFEEVTL